MPPLFNADLFISELGAVSTLPAGVGNVAPNTVVKHEKVFKAGSFKNSRGVRKSYSVADLDQMVANFGTLRDTGLFGKVPMRLDHSGSARDLCGWITNVVREGEFLYADLAFTEPEAYAKYERGTLGPRSPEVGTYETNDGTRYGPALMGLAFVDIPAIEGLFNAGTDTTHFIIDKENTDVPSTFRINGVDTQDVAAVQTALTDLEAYRAAHPEHTFRVYGAESNDFAAVQTHIESLETVITESRKAARSDFVKSLVTDNKIAAPQAESMSALADGMTDDQFKAFKESYDNAPSMSLFGKHASGTSNEGGSTGTGTTEALDEVSKLEAIVETFRKAGKDDEFIKNTKSGKRLAELKTAATGR